jgi:two-component system, cell cycle response regulator CpdR
MPRILIVDDEGAILSLLAATFSTAGYEVRTASDGPDAMRLCESEQFDAMLSDVVMPRMNGHDLARWVAGQFPRTQTVLMSGFDSGCEECPLAGRCRWLSKPFRPSEAVALIDKALSEPITL